MKDRTKVLFVLSDTGLPVPAVLGGAIESLVTVLTVQNEKYKELDMVVISKYDNAISKIQTRHKYTKFYYYRDDSRINLLKSYGYGTYLRLRKVISSLPLINNGYYEFVHDIIARESPDYVIAEGGRHMVFEGISKQIGKDKVVIHIHYSVDNLDTLRKYFGKSISVSNYMKRCWQGNVLHDDNSNVVLLNCLTEDNFRNRLTQFERKKLRKELGYDDDDYVILFCGRIVPEKGVLELIDAITNMTDKHVKLLIIGSPYFGKKKHSIYASNVDARVKKNKTRIQHLPYMSSKNLYPYFQLSDLLVVPTLCVEAAGLVAIEGQCSGIPTVVSKSGGMIEYVPNNPSMIIEIDGDVVQNIINTIDYVRNHPEQVLESIKMSENDINKYGAETYYWNFIHIIKGWYEFDNQQNDILESFVDI